MQCSSKFRAGEMPTTIPPAALAPFTALCGRPGHAPVTRTQPRAAFDLPRRPAYTDRPLQTGPHILAEPVNGITRPELPRRSMAILALSGMLVLAGCGAPQGQGTATVIGPGEGPSHPMVGQ